MLQADAMRAGKNSQPKYRGRYYRPIVPFIQGTAQTAINRATLALLPWHGDHYPGRERALYELFQGRAKIDTIRKWRNGKRKAPAWARALLKEALEKRIAELQHGVDLLA